MNKTLISLLLLGLLFSASIVFNKFIPEVFASTINQNWTDCSGLSDGTICYWETMDNYCCGEASGWVCNDDYIVYCKNGWCDVDGAPVPNQLRHNRCALGASCNPACAPVRTCDYSKTENDGCCGDGLRRDRYIYKWSDTGADCDTTYGACNIADSSCDAPRVDSTSLNCSGNPRTLNASWSGSSSNSCNIYITDGSGNHQISTACNGSGTWGGTPGGGPYILNASDGGSTKTSSATCLPKHKCVVSGACEVDNTNGTFDDPSCNNTCSSPNPWTNLSPSCSGTTGQLQAQWGNIGGGNCSINIIAGACINTISFNCSGDSGKITSLGACGSVNNNGVGSYALEAYDSGGTQRSRSTASTPNCVANPSCGDGTCNGVETCSSCPADCGSCGGAGCDPNQLTMTASSGVTMGNNITFSLSGTQGSTWVSDSFSPSGGGVVAGCLPFPFVWPISKACITNASGNFIWTHYWKNSSSGPQCSKTANYTINNSLSVTCSVSSASVPVGTQTTWTASATGGTGLYTYAWSGTDSLSGATQSIYKTYTTTGIKTGTVTVTSGTQTATCSKTLTVTVSPWIQVWGDVHSNTKISAPGGP